MHESFVFYESFYDALSDLPDEMRVQAYDAICRYALYGEEPDCSGIIKTVFKLVRPQIDRGVHFLEIQNGRHSAEYAKWRTAVYERDHYTCAYCGQVGGKLNAHHIAPYAECPNLRYSVDNGITLCEKCHKEVHRAR